jgi:hypothetical protein
VEGGKVSQGFPKSLDFKHKKITEKGPNRLVAFGFVVVLVVAIGVYIYVNHILYINQLITGETHLAEINEKTYEFN